MCSCFQPWYISPSIGKGEVSLSSLNSSLSAFFNSLSSFCRACLCVTRASFVASACYYRLVLLAQSNHCKQAPFDFLRPVLRCPACALFVSCRRAGFACINGGFPAAGLSLPNESIAERVTRGSDPRILETIRTGPVPTFRISGQHPAAILERRLGCSLHPFRW